MEPLDSRSDKQLIRQAKAGVGEAAGRLYDRYQPQIYRFVRVRVGCSQTAEDITGEVFTRMVDSLPAYHDRGVPFSAWLYQIARNLLTDWYRRSGTGKMVALEEAENLGTYREGVELAAGKSLASEKIHRFLDQMEPAFREVITLRFLAGLSVAETAALLDESVAAVKSRQHRALKKLKARLTREQFGIPG